MAKIIDDIFILTGCLLILAGTYAVSPVATWFVSGIMFILAGIVIGIGRKVK